jgi:hypothetical protein
MLQHLSLSAHLQSFARGLLRLPDVAYYLTLALLGLYATWRSIGAARAWRS